MAKTTNILKVTTPANAPRFNDAMKPLRGNTFKNVLKATPKAAIGAIVLMINVVNVNLLSPPMHLTKKA